MEQRIEMKGGGSLRICPEQNGVLLEARRAWDKKGLYKVWLSGERGEPMLLGTLIPEGGELRLLRRISRRELERNGCWPIVEAQAAVAFRFGQPGGWYREQDPGQWVADPMLRCRLKGSVLCQRTDQGRQLAFPFRTDRRIPLEPLACLARTECIDGQWYLVWEFDGDGRPVVKEGKSGGEHDTTEKSNDYSGTGTCFMDQVRVQ